jgi:diketogulonate reductase-like aldo/keto reductase
LLQLPPVGNHPDRVEKYLKRSLDKLGLNYVDIYLVHVPFAFMEEGEDIHPMSDDGNVLLDKSTNHVDIWKVQYFVRK